MKYILLWMALLLGVAQAQTPGAFPSGSILSSAALNNEFGTKADANNGMLTNPTINGGVATAPLAQILATNAALKALSSPAGGVTVLRAGFATAGDGGAAIYTFTTAPCSLNSGAGDNGSQVAPTSGSGCWTANFAGTHPTPMIWGAAGNGTTDDTAAVQAAINGAAGGALHLGVHLYKISATLAAPAGGVDLQGMQSGGGVYNYTCNYGLLAASTNMTLLNLTSGSQVRNVCFQMASAPNQNAAGTAIFIGPSYNTIVDGNQIIYPFVGIDVTGTSGPNQNIGSTLSRNVVIQPSNGGAAFRLGVSGGSYAEGDTRITDNNVECLTPTTAIGLLVLDSGGFTWRGNDVFGCGIAIKLFPASGQGVLGAFFYEVLGDTSSINDMLIDTNGGVVSKIQFSNTWTSSAGTSTFKIQNTGGGAIDNINIKGHRAIIQSGAAGTGIDIQAGVNITVSDSDVCGLTNSASSIGFAIGAASSSVNLHGNTVESCPAASGGTLGFGVAIAAGTNKFMVENNELSSATIPLSYIPAGEDALVDHNFGVDDNYGQIASAAAIALPLNSTVTITGTTSVGVITGGWSNRKVTLFTPSGLTFNQTVGGMCVAKTVGPFASTNVTWIGPDSCWSPGN